MATLDELVVKLILDAKEFAIGRKKAGEELDRTRQDFTKTSKEWEANSKRAMDTFSKVRNEILAIGGAFLTVSAIKSFAENIITTDAATGRLATNLGMSVEKLSMYEGAARKMGGSTESMAAGLQKIYDLQEALKVGIGIEQFGNRGLQLLLAKGGVGAEFFDRSLSVEQRLLMLAKAFKAVGTEALAYGKAAGFSEEFITVLRQGDKELIKFANQSRVVTKGAATESQQLIAEWDTMVDRMKAAGERLVMKLSPLFLKLADDFTKWLANKDNVEMITHAVDQLVKFLRDLANMDWGSIKSGITTIAEASKGIADAFGGFATVLEYLGAAAIGARLGGFAGALTGLGLVAGGKLLGKSLEEFAKTDKFAEMANRPGYSGSNLEWLMKNLGSVNVVPSEKGTTIYINNVNVNANNATDFSNSLSGAAKSGMRPNMSTIHPFNTGTQ